MKVYVWVGLVLLVSPGVAQAQGEAWWELNSQAVSLYRAEHYPEALEKAKEALTQANAVFGVEHPSVATALNNLAAIYQALGEYEEAEPLYQKALNIDEKVLGEDHPNTAADQDNIEQLQRDKAESQALPPTGQDSTPEPFSDAPTQ